jgi:uncharacterized membrane protein
VRTDLTVAKKSGQRLLGIDIWRGINIMFVISSHLFFGLLNDWNISISSMFYNPFILVFGIFSSVGQMFFFLSGCSQVLSMEKQVDSGKLVDDVVKTEIKRGLFLILVGTIYDPLVYFDFGIVDTLECIGLSNIILALAYRSILQRRLFVYHEKTDATRLPKASIRLMLISLVILAISPLMRVIIGYPQYAPGIEPLILAVPPSISQPITLLQGWLTTSFFPVFPWLAYFFAGGSVAAGLLAARSGGVVASRLYMKKILKRGLLLMIVGLAVMAGTSLFGQTALPYWDQPAWALEMSLNVQPLNTETYVFYWGMSEFAIAVLSIIFDYDHSKKWTRRIDFVKNKLGMRVVINTWIRFSYLSLTIYILQYTWIPTLRFIKLFTGIQIMYMFPQTFFGTLLLFGIVFLAWFIFAAFARWAMNKKHTFEWLLRWVSSLTLKPIDTRLHD